MSVTKQDVLNVAHLARLSISDEEVDKYVHNLSNILQLVETLDKVDTSAVEPMAHPLDVTQRMREDKVTETDQRELFQSIAPATESGLYLVNKVVE